MTRAPKLLSFWGIGLVSVVLLLAGAGTASAATCSLAGKERKLGPTYTTSLSVTRTSCASGRALVTAYYKCRVRSGGKKGRCRRQVSGYSCTEKRSSAIPTQFDAKVTCRKGAARVVHTYTQFT